jgi:hypothetical protein
MYHANLERKKITKDEAMDIVLDYVERWNKQDEDKKVAEACRIIQGEK